MTVRQAELKVVSRNGTPVQVVLCAAPVTIAAEHAPPLGSRLALFMGVRNIYIHKYFVRTPVFFLVHFREIKYGTKTLRRAEQKKTAK